MPRILVPTPLRRFTQGKGVVDVRGDTVGELLAELERLHPGIRAHVRDEEGGLRRFVHVYLNDADVPGLDTPVTPTDEVSIVLAIAGG